jgi:hypoxanthine phosphoribosyltransferase
MSPEDGAPRQLIEENTLQARIAELAREIDDDYDWIGPDEPLICLGVLKGSVFFMVDLLKQMRTPVKLDFFQTSSYGASTTPGEVRLKKDVDLALRGHHVLLIEDIVDTGWTLNTVLELLRFRGAASVKLVALLDKAERREVKVQIDYTGFSIDDLFVVGYGLDYDERYRNLPYIGVLDDDQTLGV